MLAMGRFGVAAAFFRPVFNSLSSPSNSSAARRWFSPGRWENGAVLPGNFPVVERAEHEAAAVGAEVAGEIMCGHNEKYAARHLKACARGVKKFANAPSGVF
jgi:hypothetical protein